MIDRVTGKFTVSIPALVTAVSIAAPIATTHFKVISAGAEINSENDSFVADTKRVQFFRPDSTPSAALTLENAFTADSASPLFLT